MFIVNGVSKCHTVKLTFVVEANNANVCDEHFWSTPIDNADETVGLSEKTSWRVKGRYVAEPLNKVNTTYEKGSSSGTKDNLTDNSSVQENTLVRKTRAKVNVHKSAEEFAAQKRQRNARYNKHLQE